MNARLRRPVLGSILRRLLAARGSVQAPLYGEWKRELAIIRQTRRLVPLLMDDAAALHLLTCVRAARRFKGAMAEAGVFQGGSARLICEAKGDTPLHLFDIFECLQAGASPQDELQNAVRTHFGPLHGEQANVQALLEGYDGVFLHPGFFPNSISKTLESTGYSFVHIDLDLPPSIGAALVFFQPRMVPGGIIIGDDFTDPAVRDCFDTFFAPLRDTRIELPWGQVMIVKQG